ncbi:BTB/POZ and TAZ domain-containing protein 2 [Heracleum sosnowskyi]|uniref:BTB/POZ and TAZ domain-containing protein 2 n=1 Tax=Heracleum sosnowskyi TaxID=360622 RepID=A0AAD8MW97_9APIA|nr:BTB/POZ and TAZ domain-containing protein 2 [Heracleum sosnowskyi]
MSHVYLVPQLKQRCTKALAQELTIENVVDVLQLAKLCDAPGLYLKSELRKKRTRRHKEEQSLYVQLSEAMECLEHICTEGCTSVGPYDKEPSKSKSPCNKFSICEGLQQSIKHYATCKKRVDGGCMRCTLFFDQKYSSVSCLILLGAVCWQFKLKMRLSRTGNESTRWKLLVRKVVSAKAITSLSMPKRKREDEPRVNSGIRTFQL